MSEPLAPPRPHAVKFGKVIDEDRGTGLLMDPPLEQNDDYFWLRDDKRENPEVLNYLKEENAYTLKAMEDTVGLQEQLYQELKGRLKEDDSTYPYKRRSEDSPYEYYSTIAAGQSYHIYKRKGPQGEEVLLDVNLLAVGKATCDVQRVTTSPDHSILSYAIDCKGNEHYTVVFQDLKSGKVLDRHITDVQYGDYEWSPSGKYVYYSLSDEADRPAEVWRYELATGARVCLFREEDKEFNVGFEVSGDERWLFIATCNSNSDEIWVTDAESQSPPRVLQPRTRGLKYDCEVQGEYFYMRTNADGAVNFKLMRVPVQGPCGKEYWLPVERPHSEAYIDGLAAFHDHLVVSLKHETLGFVAVKRNGGNWHLVTVPCATYQFELGTNAIYQTDKLRLRYTSLTSPACLYEYDVPTGDMKVLKRKEVPGYDQDLYDSKLIWVPSFGGVKVPLALIYKKDNDLKHKPVHLYAYGSYGVSLEHCFSSSLVSLLDRGFVCARAHVRGGSDLGYQWYLDGKHLTKMNTFYDFLACSEYLIREGITRPSLLGIEGCSAGGLVMGAALTMRPDLFGAVVGDVPFVDVLNTMCDSSIPLTVGEHSIVGNPNKIGDYTYMKQYCPYTNLKALEYPATLLIGGLHDPRVGYWEPAKFQAKLRSLRQDDNLHLLRVELEKGHFSATDRYESLKEVAFIWAFLLKTLK